MFYKQLIIYSNRDKQAHLYTQSVSIYIYPIKLSDYSEAYTKSFLLHVRITPSHGNVLPQIVNRRQDHRNLTGAALSRQSLRGTAVSHHSQQKIRSHATSQQVHRHSGAAAAHRQGEPEHRRPPSLSV